MPGSWGDLQLFLSSCLCYFILKKLRTFYLVFILENGTLEHGTLELGTWNLELGNPATLEPLSLVKRVYILVPSQIYLSSPILL